MSDSEEDGHAGLSGFLFGNLDEDNKLDADYLDAETRGQLQALGKDQLGLDASFKDLQDGEPAARFKYKRGAGEEEKHADAINYENEEELVDYAPEVNKDLPIDHASDVRGGGSSSMRKNLHAAESASSTVAKIGKPFLAKDGANILLRFSQLFAESSEARKGPAKAPLRALTGLNTAPSLDEETVLKADFLGQEVLSSMASSEGDTDVEDDNLAEAQKSSLLKEAAASPDAQEQKRKQTGGTSQVRQALQRPAEMESTSEIIVGPVQLVNWEDRIFWGEPEAAALQSIPKEEDMLLDDRDPAEAQTVMPSLAALPSSHNLADEGLDGKPILAGRHENVWLAESGWEEDVRWDSDESHNPAPVHSDMNDPALIFQLLQSGHSSQEVDKAAALIIPAQPKVKIVGAPPLGKGRIFTLLARQNVSLDEEYAKRKAKKGSLASYKHRHSVPALQLATLPPKYLDPGDAVHRPRGLWLPLSSKGKAKVREGEKSSVRIVSLVGHAKRAPKVIYKAVELQITSLNSLWQEAVKNSKFADCRHLEPGQIDLWYRGPKPQPLDREIALTETGIPQDANMEISLTVYGMQPLLSRDTDSVPEALSSTPINVAFSKTKQLTAADGRLLVLEYLEESPLLLSRPGMVVRTSTYYRKTDDEDTKHEALLEEKKWKVGSLEVLQPNEEAPFLLGDVQPGRHQLAVESNMARSIGCSHAVPGSDFLVIRAASGALSVREVTGYVTVGQQEPLRRIPVPQSKDCRELEENRMVAYVMRELRRQKVISDRKKRRNAASEETPPVVTVREIADLFPTLSEGVIRSRLKDRCSCVVYKDDAAETYRLQEGVEIADERQLRLLVRPEEWCAHESMSNSLALLHQQGVSQQDKLSAMPIDRLRIAAEQLSPPEIYDRAASQLELLIQSTPWALTDNFVSALRENRGSLALTGPGDPTARGDGFSYMKEIVRSGGGRAVDAAALKEGNITGTNKDLRRLSMVASRNLLLKLGLAEEDIKGLGRWQRIAAVRDLSTAAAGEEVGELGKIGTRYARLAKSSTEEQSRARRIQASQIFERQIAALQDDGKELSDDESWGDELEKELEGEEVASASKRKGGNEDEDGDEEEDLEELRKGGFLGEGAEACPLSKKRPKLEAKAGERRIKRTIVFAGLDGSRQTRTILYTDRDKMQALNDLYRRADGKEGLGFGKRTISGGTTWLAAGEDEGQAVRKTKKNMANIRCKACGQMGHYKSNKLCPLYEQTYNKAAKAKKEAKIEEDRPLRITLPSSPVKRKLSMQGGDPSKRARLDPLSPTSPPWKSAGSLRKQLGNRVLLKALSNAKSAVPEQHWKPFLMAVTKISAPDYNDFVPSNQEMHLDKIERKVKNCKYASSQDFLADCQKIAENAAVYNAPGNGKYGGPALVDWAQAIVTAIQNELKSEDSATLVAEIEEAMRTQDAEKAANAEAPASIPVEEAPAADEVPVIWVQCTRCQKWRKVSQKVNDETVPTTQDGAWHCDWDFERPGASCDLPDDELAEQ